MLQDLWGTYIDLDTQERTKFAQNTHEYLITKVNKKQITLNNATDLDISEFNMPTKELFFVFTDSNQTLNCKNNICNPKLFTAGSLRKIDNNNNMTLKPATPAGTTANDLFNYQFSKDLNTANMQNVNLFVRDSGMLTFSGAIENFEKFTFTINGHDRFTEKEVVILDSILHLWLVIKFHQNIYISIHFL